MSFYYYSVCHVCKKAKTDLKKCSQCKVLHYCSREHQRMDWPAHKGICKAITKNKKFLVLPPGSDAADFNQFKMTIARLWCFELGRELKTFELEMCMYPKVCVVCYSSEVTIVCQGCFSAAYCSEEHKNSHKDKHEEFCQKLKLALEVNQSLFEYNIVRGCTHFDFQREIADFPENMEEFIKIIRFKDNDFSSYLDRIILSDFFCTAVNIVYALEKSKFVDKRRAKRAKLVLHVLAPNMANNIDWIQLTEFLSHWIVNLKRVKIFLIHPDVEDERFVFTLNCADNLRKKFTGMVLSVDEEYHTCAYALSRPDLVILFNTNLNTGNWKENIVRMMDYRSAPIILTAYSQLELKKNVDKFPASQIKFYVEPQLNKFASLRPVRNEEEGCDPVIYHNQFIAILARK